MAIGKSIEDTQSLEKNRAGTSTIYTTNIIVCEKMEETVIRMKKHKFIYVRIILLLGCIPVADGRLETKSISKERVLRL